ncbi:hypothetical protein JTB14_032773 [Gonioctena quinquepunctata]|nr:hypothetical protein JTB14_032773 [Gonioctena quinquepunctata]
MYASVGYCLTNVSDTLTDLYTSENSSNPITQLIYTQINSVVVKAAALVTKLHNRLDTAFDSLVSGTSSTSKSLDIGLDLDVDLGLDGSDLLTLTSRLSAGSSRGIISNRVNRILKEYCWQFSRLFTATSGRW